MDNPTDRQYINAAKRIYEEDGILTVDDLQKVDRKTDTEGAWVAARVWVRKEWPEDES